MITELEAGQTDRLVTRADVVFRKTLIKGEVAAISKVFRGLSRDAVERVGLYQTIQSKLDEQAQLADLLGQEFIPQHSPLQLISPRALFVSPLFRVCSRQLDRARDTSLELKSSSGTILFKYQGPELRQSDGFVFMSLLNLARDHRLGESVSFSPEDFCKQVFSRYDGPARSRLKEHIKRLQRGLLEFEQFSVQLCCRFDHPRQGPWKVSIDRDVLQVFQRSPEVWLDLPLRQRFPEGLATWLYSFVESQSRLIPTAVTTLKELCGSNATDDSFTRTLRIALRELAAEGVIDPKWRVSQGRVGWRKCSEACEGPQDQNQPGI